ncbi:hypothetical protein A3736_11980 [Erythrobacter sp. HI0063]|jgi:hypothetical protein|uniref:hypothetical protein n=1 Tax=unclassified Erythrobacter TaxID=2633097 RepID=UPI0007C3F3F8|nr:MULTISPECIES: hypothetical protein [unclassified Erythrobacter]KZY55098.1 hypothetical protein A3736_11980 [Erythrobacter sp. HI0063]MBO9511196.1 hypothetical protein [Erythrobacter sp. A6_0]|tara:strand:- start:1784 stop:1993 length:210 start_codon:yes stop_codon:yes gene_type:complete
MLIKKLAIGTAAASLIAAPVVAQTAPVTGESELGGESITPAFIVLAIGAIGIGVLLLTDDDDDDAPISA